MHTFSLFKRFYLFLAVLDLPCCVGFLWLWRVGATPQLQCTGFSPGGFSCCRAQALEHVGFSSWATGASEVQAQQFQAHRLSCPVACGIFRSRGLNACLLHWKADSQPLDHQGSPCWGLFFLVFLLSAYGSTLFCFSWLTEKKTSSPLHLSSWKPCQVPGTLSRQYGSHRCRFQALVMTTVNLYIASRTVW